jgi:hypothetical protein
MESSRQIRPPVLPNEQKRMGAPVVNAPGLPSMEKVGDVRTLLQNTALPLMGDEAQTEPRGTHLMERADDMFVAPPSHGVGPQRPKERERVSAQSEGYVRLEVHFEDGRLSIIDAKDVPGPLINPNAVIQGYAYEVLIGDRQISLGSIPDVGVRRAFANRDVPGPHGRHRFVEVPAFDFFVRIPKVQLTAENLSKMDIVLHDVSAAPDRIAPELPMSKQPSLETAEVARISGLRLESMPAVVRSHLERIINER